VSNKSDFMGLEAIARQLSEIERKTLLALSENERKTVSGISASSGLPLDSVRRSLEWLKEKQLIETKEKEQQRVFLSRAGEKTREKGLPEIRLLDWLEEKETVSLSEARQKSGLEESEFNLALGWKEKYN
jgi:phenylalanyl-tRNA synthetase alpha chain